MQAQNQSLSERQTILSLSRKYISWLFGPKNTYMYYLVLLTYIVIWLLKTQQLSYYSNCVEPNFGWKSFRRQNGISDVVICNLPLCLKQSVHNIRFPKFHSVFLIFKMRNLYLMGLWTKNVLSNCSYFQFHPSHAPFIFRYVLTLESWINESLD